MIKTTTIKVSEETHKNVLKTKTFLKKTLKDFPIKAKVDNDFVVGVSTDFVLNNKQVFNKAVEGWKTKK